MFDTVIRGGSVIDGTGAPARTADVAIRGDRIVEVGKVQETGRREVDAAGLLVTPGFVDIHTHFDGQATWDNILAPSSWHGVTTLAMGNCGVGFAPARPEHRSLLISLLEGVEDIPGSALSEGLQWDWESFPEYLDALGRLRWTVDVGAHLPHAPLRVYAMGERGADPDERPSEAELDTLGALIREAIAAGALGFSTSRTRAHRTVEGDPIGTIRADELELDAIASALNQGGRGVIELVSDAVQTGDDVVAKAELGVIERLARRSGRPLSLLLLQSMEAPDRWRQALTWIDGMVSDGVPVKGQVALRPIGVLLGLELSLSPFLPCPSFSELQHLPLPELVRALRSPGRKDQILREHASFTSAGGQGPGMDLLRRQISTHPHFKRRMTMFDNMYILSDPVNYELDANDSIGARAEREGIDPASLVYDLLTAKDGKQLLYFPSANFANGNLYDLRDMIQGPNVIFGLSDAGAHCTAISDASATTSSLTTWVRDRNDGTAVPLEWLVHGHTQRNAAYMGWTDRGVLAGGYLADVNVIDFEQLGCRHPVLARDLPAGGGRLVQGATGYKATFKSGRLTFSDGEHTGELPGHLLRGT
ncbi:MAG: amidohydrolase family protein [Acidimicrobiia bacterium]|nr:amidohydrolase family protein [Acidimicrobiia bacterium]